MSRRYIDADLLERIIMNADYLDNDTAYDVIAEIDNTPTAEVIDVVRCKDCRKREKINGKTVCPIAWIKAEVSDDDYCSYGEMAEA